MSRLQSSALPTAAFLRLKRAPELRMRRQVPEEPTLARRQIGWPKPAGSSLLSENSRTDLLSLGSYVLHLVTAVLVASDDRNLSDLSPGCEVGLLINEDH